MNLAALRAKAKEKRDAARAILATATADNGRTLTVEETASFQALMDEVDGLEASIAQVVRLETSEASAEAPQPVAARGQGPLANPGRTNAGGGNITAPGEPANRSFETLGHFIAAVRFNPNDQRLTGLYDENAGAEAAANMTDEMRAEMRMDTGANGGFMIPREFRTSMLEVETPGSAPIRANATVIDADPNSPDNGVTMPALDQSGNAAGHQFGGVTVNWVAEGGQKPLTDAKLKSVDVDTYEVAGYMIVTDKLLRNWKGADAFMRKQFGGAIREAGEYAFLRGDGTGKPTGIIGHASTYLVNRATAGTFKYLDAVAMLARFRMTGGQSAFWLMPQSVLPQLMTMQDPAGHYIWKPDAKDGFAGTLLGYPVKWNPTSPALGTSGDVMLIDAAFYIIKDGSGPFVAASEHVLFTQNKTVLKAFWNVGGKPWLTAPHYDAGGYQVSPFVQLGPVAA
ncbi:major capsid protein [Caulobacter phage TMCBR2]|uniref:Major capsid protein n=1 Tax=Caulobacter phage TMCBR2 TaxID=3025404 RepID=A0AAE9YAH8_9CAUD|nr:major capsid protein [Caulobacter phage TMCBR2]WDS38254.1 major capsid protein [Caulobacter phage TMCBR3]